MAKEKAGKERRGRVIKHDSVVCTVASSLTSIKVDSCSVTCREFNNTVYCIVYTTAVM